MLGSRSPGGSKIEKFGLKFESQWYSSLHSDWSEDVLVIKWSVRHIVSLITSIQQFYKQQSN